MFTMPTREKPLFNSIREFDLLSQIGYGAFSDVFHGRHRSTNQDYAVKVVDFYKIEEVDQENIQKEIEAHRLLNHKNVVALYDFFKEGDVVYFIMELCQKKNLFRFIADGLLTKEDNKRIFKQTCDAVKHVHTRDLIVRDIKPENILLDKHNNAKLCDFGWASRIDDEEYRRLKAGTLTYMSPESITGLPQGKESDIWSLGVLLYELYHNKEPYVGSSLEKQLDVINNQKIQFNDKKIPKEAKDLVEKLLKIRPKDRAGFEEIYRSDFLKDYNRVKIKKPEDKKEEKFFLSRDVSVHRYEKKPHEGFGAGTFVNAKMIIKPAVKTKLVKHQPITITKKGKIPLKTDSKKDVIKSKRVSKKQERTVAPSIRLIEIRGEKELRNIHGKVLQKERQKQGGVDYPYFWKTKPVIDNRKTNTGVLGTLNLFKDQGQINFGNQLEVKKKRNGKRRSSLFDSIDDFKVKGIANKKIYGVHEIKTTDYSSNISHIVVKGNNQKESVYTGRVYQKNIYTGHNYKANGLNLYRSKTPNKDSLFYSGINY